MPPAWNKSPKLSEESLKEIKVERENCLGGTHLELSTETWKSMVRKGNSHLQQIALNLISEKSKNFAL
jgi:hypothetical protein